MEQFADRDEPLGWLLLLKPRLHEEMEVALEDLFTLDALRHEFNEALIEPGSLIKVVDFQLVFTRRRGFEPFQKVVKFSGPAVCLSCLEGKRLGPWRSW